MPFFSVIIPTYNRAALLREALESVFAQTFMDYEVIVIDDGSTDDTDKVAASFGDKIRFLRQANQGPGSARNLGLQSATGRYIAFLDSDDIWFPWTLDVFAQAIAGHQGPNFIAGHGLARELQATVRGNDCPWVFKKSEDFLEASVKENAFGGTPGMVVKAEAIRAAGGFMDRFVNGEDLDLCFRLGTAPGFVRIESPPLFLQRTDVVHISRDQSKSIAGVRLLFQREQAGLYPDRPGTREVRRRIFTAMARSVSVSCAETGDTSEAIALYGFTLGWQLRQARWKYCLSFPFFILMQLMKPKGP
jgi:hypothetical protein